MAYQQSFIAQVWPMITRAMETVEPIYEGRVYSIVPPRNTTFPVLTYYSQDLGGKNDDTIGNNGWNGVITLKSIATDQDTAFDLLATALHQLATTDIVLSGLITLSGEFNIQFEQSKPITFPLEKLTGITLYQAGVLVTVYIKPNIQA